MTHEGCLTSQMADYILQMNKDLSLPIRHAHSIIFRGYIHQTSYDISLRWFVHARWCAYFHRWCQPQNAVGCWSEALVILGGPCFGSFVGQWTESLQVAASQEMFQGKCSGTWNVMKNKHGSMQILPRTVPAGLTMNPAKKGWCRFRGFKCPSLVPVSSWKHPSFADTF